MDYTLLKNRELMNFVKKINLIYQFTLANNNLKKIRVLKLFYKKNNFMRNAIFITKFINTSEFL